MEWKSLGSLTSATFWAIAIGLLLVACAIPCHPQSLPPLRGVYTPGFNATNSRVMPKPGLTYSNTFMDYSFNQIRCTVCGELVPQVDVLLDVNVFMWVSKKKILGGNYALVAGLPVTNSSLSLAGLKPIGGGGGFADSFYQPATLGWHPKRADIMTAWQKTLKREGIPYFRMYDLRSTYATRLSAGGVADEWVRQLLRQGDAKVFKKRLANEMSLDPGTAVVQ